MKYKRRIAARSRVKGFTLIEVSIAAVIAAAAITYGVWSHSQELQAEVARSQVGPLSLLNDATGLYLSRNAVALKYNTPIAGVANIYAPTVDELKALGVLEAGFQSSNLYGGTYRVRVTREGCGAEPSSCLLTSVAYLTTPIRDPQGDLNQAALGAAVMAGGGKALMSTVDAPGTLAGLQDSYLTNNPLGSVAGILAMRNSLGGEAGGEFVRIDGESVMTGSLKLGDNDVEGVRDVLASRDVRAQAGWFTGMTVDETLTAKHVTATNNLHVGRDATVQGHHTIGQNAVVGGNLLSGSVTLGGYGNGTLYSDRPMTMAANGAITIQSGDVMHLQSNGPLYLNPWGHHNVNAGGHITAGGQIHAAGAMYAEGRQVLTKGDPVGIYTRGEAWVEAPNAWASVTGFKEAVCPNGMVLRGIRWYQHPTAVDDEHVDALCMWPSVQ